MTQVAKATDISFETPGPEDGFAMWQLVRDGGVLDLNSSYLYILLGDHFRDTCLVARHEGKIVGMVTGYYPPSKEDVYFVWQVAVHPSMRGRGVASQILERLVQTKMKGKTLETTVTPDNIPSERMFKKLADKHNLELQIQEGYPEAYFPPGSHEPERLLRMGPF